MTGIITGPHLFEMDELVSLANEDRIMIGDASEINLKEKYKFITYANLKSILELDPSTSPTNVAQEDTVTFVSATDTVTLPSTPISNSVDVHVDGVIQYEGVHYNIVGNDIVFDEVLPIDTVVRYKYWESLGPGAAIQDLQNVTDQGSTTTKKITAQDFEFRTTAGRLLYPGGTNTMLGQVGGGFFLAAGGNTIINSNVANDGAVISKLQVSGAVTFSSHTANPGETLPTVVDENGLLNTVAPYTLDSVSSVDPVTSNALTVGSIKWNNVNGRILSSLNDPLFTEEASSGWKLYHNGFANFQSEDEGLKLLASNSLYFEGSAQDIVMTMEWGSGGQFDILDNFNHGFRMQSDGDIEVLTGLSEEAGTIRAEFRKDGKFWLGNRAITTPAKMAVFNAGGELGEADLPGSSISGTAGVISKFDAEGDGIDDSQITQTAENIELQNRGIRIKSSVLERFYFNDDTSDYAQITGIPTGGSEQMELALLTVANGCLVRMNSTHILFGHENGIETTGPASATNPSGVPWKLGAASASADAAANTKIRISIDGVLYDLLAVSV